MRAKELTSNPIVHRHLTGVAESLSSMVNQDQAERNEYKAFVKSQANGDWTKGATLYAERKKRPSNDIFGDAARLNQFMKMKFEFDKFTDEDWHNYWLLAQHCDGNRAFQKNALSIIKKYQGPNHSNYKYLHDRISVGLTGKQKYGTQNKALSLNEGFIDFIQRKLGFKWGKIGDVVKGSIVAEYLDSQDDTMDPDRYINSKFKLINITTNEAEKYREISDLTGWPGDTLPEKVKGWGIEDYKMDRIRKNDVTYQSLMKRTPVVSRRGFIINGNHRIARALEMGMDPIPILKEL